MSNKLYIYANKQTPRLHYTCEVIFKLLMGLDYTIINDIKQGSPLINYSSDDIACDAVVIKPHSLLFEQNIQPQNIKVEYENGVPYFFKTIDTGALKHDVLASTFYLLTRYEEYLPFSSDTHGRFTAKNSLAHHAGFLHLPVVHYWAEKLQKALLEKFPNLEFKPNKFNQINTIDIDVAYAYKGKPWLRQIGSFVKSLMTFNRLELNNRWAYLTTGRDYLDTYSYIEQMAKVSQQSCLFFFEVGSYAKYDRNIPLNKVYKALIKRLSEVGDIGIHPSYQSNDQLKLLPVLIDKLHQVVAKPITKSRQHFLKLTFPNTYEQLISQGITEDYTMGFSDKIGFRAGIALPYPFFNLTTNEQRPLQIIPFQVMDGTLKDYMMLPVEDAKAKSLALKQSVQAVGGTFVSVFHNSSLSDQGEWQGWRKVYDALLTG